MNSIKTIVFDLGGVLVDWDPRYLYRKLLPNEEAVEHFLQQICTMEWNEQQDAGRTIQEANASLIQSHPEQEELILAYYGRWEEMLGGVIRGSEKILYALHQKKHCQLLALTNWSAETFPIAKRKYRFLDLFEGILVSGREQLKKPDPQIFQLLIDRYELNPKDMLFIDDSQRNVSSARTLGIQSIHFTDSTSLGRQLQDLELL